MSPKKPRLLCIDDDAQSLAVRRLLFEAFGFDVETCTDPRRGLSLHRKNHFDAAVVDFQMPVMNGAEVAREMKSVRADVPVVILSGLIELPANTPVFYDRFLCKAEPSSTIVKEIEALIATSGHGNGEAQHLPLHQRAVALGALALGMTSEAVARRRGRKAKGMAMSGRTVPARA